MLALFLSMFELHKYECLFKSCFRKFHIFFKDQISELK